MQYIQKIEMLMKEATETVAVLYWNGVYFCCPVHQQY